MMALLCAAGTLFTSVGAGGGPVEGAYEAISKPSEDRTLSCPRPGLISQILAQEGQSVKVGEAVVQMDDREEKAKLAADKVKAEDDTRVRAQEKIRDQSKVDLKRIQWTFDKGGSTPFELDKAKIDLEVAEAQVKMAAKEQEQAQLNYEQTRVLVDKMRLVSPINGIVHKILAQAGESVELNTKVIQIVNLNPLWVEAQVPQSVVHTLKKDAAVDVVYPNRQHAKGKVVFIAPVGDAASETILVRVEVPNPELRHAGEQVRINFADPVAVH